MPTTALQSILPLETTATPATVDEAVELMRDAAARRRPVYPLGGGTSLDLGVVPRQPGLGLITTGLTRVVDYPARDMTVTVESGITLAALSELLSHEGQRLGVDAPQGQQGTLGGLIATNHSGPRRYGLGTIRDYVIGISAIDGRGSRFAAGGRVVKNVAGYDFCKLLCGSLGTLGLITQVTLKLRPVAESTALLATDVASADEAESLLAALVGSQTTPMAIELLAGGAWQECGLLAPGSQAWARVVVGYEGTADEIGWQIERLTEEWRGQGVGTVDCERDSVATSLWRQLVDFSAADAPLLLKASVPPSQVVPLAERIRRADPDAALQAHAGSGVLLARLSQYNADASVRLLIRELHPLARAAGGSLAVWRCASPADLTRQAVWGPVPDDIEPMRAVKRQFDPHDVLNPGRFVV